MGVSQTFPVLLVQQEQGDDETGHEKSNGSLGQGSQPGQKIQPVIPVLLFGTVPQVEAQQRPIHEQKQHAIREYALGNGKELQGHKQKDAAEESHFFSIELLAGLYCKPQSSQPEQGGKEPGAEFTEAKKLETQGDHPVGKNRFIIPVAAIDLG